MPKTDRMCPGLARPYVPKLQEDRQEVLQGQRLGKSIDEGYHVAGEARLHGRKLQELVHNHFRESPCNTSSATVSFLRDEVTASNLYKIMGGFIPRLTSMTTRIPARSDSSRMSEIPTILPSSTSFAICSTREACVRNARWGSKLDSFSSQEMAFGERSNVLYIAQAKELRQGMGGCNKRIPCLFGREAR